MVSETRTRSKPKWRAKMVDKKLPAVVGAVHDLSIAGFNKIIEESNAAAKDGYQLVGIFVIEKKLTAVWRLVPKRPNEPVGEFFGDDM